MNAEDITSFQIDINQDRSIEYPIVLTEITALIRYACERGLDPNGKITGPLFEAVKNKKIDCHTLALYSQLSRMTYYSPDGKTVLGVNGRTILDTEHQFLRKSIWVMFFALSFLLFAIAIDTLGVCFKPADLSNNTMLFFLKRFLCFISPILWGSAGACVFILKRLTDKASDRCFDSKKWRGWGTRIILGGILGLIVVILFNNINPNESGTPPETIYKLSMNAIAFLAGLGVKVTYGALEKLIEVIYSKFNLKPSDETTDRE